MGYVTCMLLTDYGHNNMLVKCITTSIGAEGTAVPLAADHVYTAGNTVDKSARGECHNVKSDAVAVALHPGPSCDQFSEQNRCSFLVVVVCCVQAITSGK